MHGQLQLPIGEMAIDQNKSFEWLRYGNRKGETESLIVAAKEQALKTRPKEGRIHRSPTDRKCRICKSLGETIEHIIP